MVIINTDVKNFHLSRNMFALKGTELVVQKEKTTQGHKEWFASLGWFDTEKEEDILDNVIRGYADKEGLYIYKGNNFDITLEDVNKLVPYLTEIQTILGLREGLPVYAGVIKSKQGMKYKPKRFLGSIATITPMRIVIWND